MGLCNLTTEGLGSVPGWELRSHEPHGAAKIKKEKKKKIYISSSLGNWFIIIVPFPKGRKGTVVTWPRPRLPQHTWAPFTQTPRFPRAPQACGTGLSPAAVGYRGALPTQVSPRSALSSRRTCRISWPSCPAPTTTSCSAGSEVSMDGNMS